MTDLSRDYQNSAFIPDGDAYYPRWQAEAAARGNDLINRLHSGPMTGITWQITLLCPTAIAIHDDGQMSGQLVLMQLTEQR